MVYSGLCMFVYLHDITKTDAARITKLDIEMFHDESQNDIDFGVKRSTFKFTCHKKTLPTWVFALL